MKLALIPWSEEDLHDNIFYTTDADGQKAPKDDWLNQMQDEFVKHGDAFHTIDCYESIEEIDYILFMSMVDWHYVRDVLRHGGQGKMIYCNAEPPVVVDKNCPEGFAFIKRFFRYIMTWNRDWVDNETIFLRNNPYVLKNHKGNVPFSERKLITGISRNKTSTHPDELYSERERAYTFYEQNYPEQFQFYGTRWNREIHPGYGGPVENKYSIYQQYRFAICYENMKNIRDYITEKIWDCLTSGIVPVYAGATNIEDLVPKECFIARDDFSDYQELTGYLMSVTEEEYQKYLDAANRLLTSGVDRWLSGATYANQIYEAIQCNKDFHVSLISRIYVELVCMKQDVLCGLKRVVKKYKNK